MVDQTQEINKVSWDDLLNAKNASLHELPEDMTFNASHIVSITAYSVLMVLSGLANMTVLYLIIQQRRKSKKKQTSMINPMLMNLAIADLLVTFLMMPLEIGWSYTVSWKAGDAMCRIMSFFRIFGLYLSGFVLMCISVDRYYAVLRPLSMHQMKLRGRIMLAAAWIASALCSLPQIAIFHVESHPVFTYYKQCVTYHSFSSYYHDLAYKIFGLVMMYGLPLFVIVFCYSSILREIYRKYQEQHKNLDTFRRSSAGYLGRARIRTLQMTITIVTGFIVCWTPYYVMCLWYWIDTASAELVDARIQKALFIFASGNSIMNPVVYGLFNVRPTLPPSTPVTRTTLPSAVPDLVNSNTDCQEKSGQPVRKVWQWRLQHRSLSSDTQDPMFNMKSNTNKKKKFFFRVDTQRSFSSEGTDIAEIRPTSQQQSADVKRYWWRQKGQRVDQPEGEEDGASGWTSHTQMQISDS